MFALSSTSNMIKIHLSSYSLSTGLARASFSQLSKMVCISTFRKRECFPGGSMSPQVPMFVTLITLRLQMGKQNSCCSVSFNLGNCYQSTTEESWESDQPCQKDGILLDSVGFQHGGAQAYVVPSPNQVFPLAIVTYTC